MTVEVPVGDPPRTTNVGAVRGRPRWFLAGLALVVVLAGGIRVGNVLIWRPTCDEDLVAIARSGQVERLDPTPTHCFAVRGDALYAYYQGLLNGQGHLYVDAADFLFDRGSVDQPGAQDPPLYALVLGGVTAVGGESPTAHRLVSALVGTVGVALIALVGARVGGSRAGLLAGFAAAVYPILWINDGMLMGETVYTPLVAAVMLASFSLWNRPSAARVAVLGLLIGLAALSRGEAVLLLVFLLPPLLWGIHRREGGSLGRPVARLATAGAMVAVTLAPWVGWNLVRFEHPVTLTSGTGAVLSAGSCDPEFYGEYLGFWGNCFALHIDAGLVDPPPPGADLDESELDLLKRQGATAYLGDHLDRLPVVVLARVGRMWELYQPAQNTTLNWQLEGRDKFASEAGIRMYYLLLGPAAAGAVLLWRRRIPLSPFLSMAATVTVTAAISFGLTRYRVPADVAIVVLAAVAVDALLGRRWPAPDGARVLARAEGLVVG